MTAPVAGTYTVSWRTLGGCDPGAGTSGMAGETILTVKATESPDDDAGPGELTGIPAVDLVFIRQICIYVWTVTVVEVTTGRYCTVGPAPFEPDSNFELTITLEDPGTACSRGSPSDTIVVEVNPAVAVDVDATDHNAILRAPIRATATPVERTPDECVSRTGVSTVNRNDTPGDTTDDTVSIELSVVDTTAGGEECRYDVSLELTGYLVATTHRERDLAVIRDVDPPDTLDFRVGVAARTIYLLQTVVGDSGTAGVHYALSRTCEEPDPLSLPPAMARQPAVGGIWEIEAINLVELREGHFNITAALADDPTAPDAFEGITRRVLDESGEVCKATVAVSRIPDRCVPPQRELTVDLTRAPEPTILEFEFICGDDGESATGARTG